MSIFQRNVVAKYLKSQTEDVSERYNVYKAYFLDPEVQENIRASKEEQFQEGFLRKLFAEILGYTVYPDPNFNLKTEFKNSTDSKKADGAIFLNGEPVGVIELKDHKTKDLRTVEAQAFGYKNNHKTARYVIISNFEKLRFYIDHTEEFEEFDLFNLSEDDFKRLYLILGYVNVEKGLPLTIKSESKSEEKGITENLYKDYSAFKRELFDDILAKNEGVADKLTLFRKTQKLLDRLLFIFFAEDRGLIPPNVILRIIDETEALQEMGEEKSLYDHYKTYFKWLDEGRKSKSLEIFAYNGGLFKKDELLDSLKIDDKLLETHTRKLSAYDFESDVSVDILGHIFEHSLSEIEEIQNELNGVVTDKKASKRKKDGVFYTPAYITKYIVDNTVGTLCNNKKQEMGINLNEGEELRLADKTLRSDVRQKHIDKLDAYRQWLLGLTIVDPACGSGAFLNAAVQFLKDEHKAIDEAKACLFEKNDAIQLAFSDIETEILEKNIFGVDINDESVEIAKLSLWLHTAKPGRKLNNLNNNIKCGNSLISDPEVAGEKAFDWEKEFPEVFAKGGFDVVVGNPPYVEAEDSEKSYYKEHYPAVEGHVDLYELFIQRGNEILKSYGWFAFINPNTVLSNLYSQKLRRKMVYEYGLKSVINFGMDVFEDPTVHTCILLMNKGILFSNINVKAKVKSPEDINQAYDYSVSVQDIERKKNFSFDLTLSNLERELFKRWESLPKLGDRCYLRQCIKTGDDEQYVCKSDSILMNPWKKTLRGKGMSRYCIFEDNVYLKYGDWLARNWKNQSFYECEKIAVRETGNRINACIDVNHRYFLSSLYSVYPKETYTLDDLKCLLGILNSLFATYFIKKIAFDLTEGAFTKVRTNQLARLPLPRVNQKNNSLRDELVALVDSIQNFNESLVKKRNTFLHLLNANFDNLKISSSLDSFDKYDFKTFVAELKKQKIKLSLEQQGEWLNCFDKVKSECNELSQKIAATDREIDQKVYELYGLTEEEVTIVEESTRVS